MATNPCAGEGCVPAIIPGLIGGYWSTSAKSGKLVMGSGIDNCCEVVANPCCCDDEDESTTRVNTEQTCTNTCPDGTIGDPISVTVEAGSFVGTGETAEEALAAANAAALASACAQAAELRTHSLCQEVFYNTEQTCEDVCPDGTSGETISVTIEAGEFSSEEDQETADALAMAEACAQAAALRADSPCEVDVFVMSMQCRSKTGNVACDPTSFGTLAEPVVYSGSGTSEPACADIAGKYASASGFAQPVAISDTGDGAWGTVTYGNFSWDWVKQGLGTLGCGDPRWAVVMAGSADGNPLWDDTLEPGGGSIVLSRNPARNPYSFKVGIVYNFNFTAPYEAFGSEMLIDVGDVVFTGCKTAVEDFIEEDEAAWTDEECDEMVVSLDPDEDDEFVDFTYGQTMITVGESGLELTPGSYYRFTLTFVGRTAGSADPFVPLATTQIIDFLASGTSYTTDWTGINLVSDTDLKIAGVTLTEIAAPTSVVLSADGETVTVTFTEPVFIGSGTGSGWTVEGTYGPASLTYQSGYGTNTVVYTANRVFGKYEDITAAYSNLVSGLVDGDGDLVFNGAEFNVTNNSLELSPEAQTWADLVTLSGGTLEVDSADIADSFITALKKTSYESKIKYFIPFLGSNLSAAICPIRNSIEDVPVPQSANFVDGDFSQSTGLQGNGSNKRIDTKVLPTKLGDTMNGGFGFWELSATGGSGTCLMGVRTQEGGPSFTQHGNWFLANNQLLWGTNDAVTNTAPTIGTEVHHYAQRLSATSREMYIDAVLVDSDSNNQPAAWTGAPVQYNTSIAIFAMNNSNTFVPDTYHGGRCGAAYMTDGTLTPSEVTAFQTLVQNYLMTPAGR